MVFLPFAGTSFFIGSHTVFIENYWPVGLLMRHNNRLHNLESGIREVIKKMKSFRQEVPSNQIKQARLELSAILNHSSSIMSETAKKELLLKKLQDTVEVLNSVRRISGSAKLDTAHKFALELLIEHTDGSSR